MPLKKLNLLNTFPKIKRDIKSRKKNKDINRKIAMKFGQEYFDGNREQGYGGYRYDGRWKEVAKKIVEIFNLKNGSRFLDIGCAKGFLLYDMYKMNPEIHIRGLEISSYAISCAPKEVKNKIIQGNCKKLDFEKNSFDAVICINTIHNLKIEECKKAIKEIQRVSSGNAFIQVDAYRNESELEIFKDWMLTAKTYLKPNEWIELFNEAGYTGYYFWTILENEK